MNSTPLSRCRARLALLLAVNVVAGVTAAALFVVVSPIFAYTSPVFALIAYVYAAVSVGHALLTGMWLGVVKPTRGYCFAAAILLGYWLGLLYFDTMSEIHWNLPVGVTYGLLVSRLLLRRLELQCVVPTTACAALPLRFSIRQLMLVTLLVAFGMFLRQARQHVPEWIWDIDSLRQLAYFAVINLGLAVCAGAAAWALLGRSRPAYQILWLLPAFQCAILVPTIVSQPTLGDWFRTIYASIGLVIIANLLVARSCGFRLVPKAGVQALACRPGELSQLED